MFQPPTTALHTSGIKLGLANFSVRRNVLLAVTANVVPSSLVLFTPMMVATRSSETSVSTRGTRRNIPKNGIRHTYRRENLKP
jgi:hypothetical protein